jgi:hypothetical protein
MGSRATVVAVASMVSAIASTAFAAAADPTVVIHVECAVATVVDFAPAKGEVERVFSAAGVRIVWAVGPLSTEASSSRSIGEPRHLALIVANARKPAPKTASFLTDSVLGEAVPELGRAHVFVDRITASVNARPMSASIVLGWVIAHEIGHLLLPANSHSKFGIMRASVDFTMAGLHVFTDRQADAIRVALNP